MEIVGHLQQGVARIGNIRQSLVTHINYCFSSLKGLLNFVHGSTVRMLIMDQPRTVDTGRFKGPAGMAVFLKNQEVGIL